LEAERGHRLARFGVVMVLGLLLRVAAVLERLQPLAGRVALFLLPIQRQRQRLQLRGPAVAFLILVMEMPGHQAQRLRLML
jgi:hypothetical protein